jgi:hypothetical protein
MWTTAYGYPAPAGITRSDAAIRERSPPRHPGTRWPEHLLYRQLAQGNDTDSFSATAGSILGAYFGPDGLGERWLAPFHDDIHTALAWFYERSLSKLAKRIGELPGRIAAKAA